MALVMFHMAVTRGPHKSDSGSCVEEILSIRAKKVGQQGTEVAGYTAPTTRSGEKSEVQLTFSFLFSLKAQPIGGATHSVSFLTINPI